METPQNIILKNLMKYVQKLWIFGRRQHLPDQKLMASEVSIADISKPPNLLQRLFHRAMGKE